MSWPSHGANPHFLYKQAGIVQPTEIIDFSVNTNPFVKAVDYNECFSLLKTAIEQYPDPRVSQLRKVIAGRENVLEEQLLIGNGGSECIFLLSNYFRGKRICIVEPTFGEYRKACLAFQCQIESFILTEEENWNIDIRKIRDYIKRNDVIFICHPNNPTGTTYDSDTILAMIEEAKKEHTYCVIDEAFYDFCSEPIKLNTFLQDYENLIILRSLTKMYCIPGVRLGYILAHPGLIERLTPYQPPWSVNGVAQRLGEHVLTDQSIVMETKKKLEQEREFLLAEIASNGFYVSQAKVNFFILREQGALRDTQELIQFLLANGIVPRHTYNFIGLEGHYIRLAIKTRNENLQLLYVLNRWNARC